MRWRRDQGDARHRVAQPRNQIIHLAARQLSALTGLSALSHFDLQHLGVHQIVRCHTKTTGGNLFDLGDPVSAEAIRILAPFTTVGARTDLIHPHRQRLVSLRRQSTQRHARRVKPTQNIVDRFHLIERHRRFR